MTSFVQKQHLFSLNPCPAGTPTVIGVLQTSPEQYISLEATLLMRGAGLTNCFAAFQNFDAITGATPAVLRTSVLSSFDGSMDVGLGASMNVQVNGVNNYDLSFEVTSPNELATTALMLNSLETEPTVRVYPAGPPGGLQVRRALADATPVALTTLKSIPLASGKICAIRARVHVNQDLGGGVFQPSACTWYILAKNDNGTVAILGDTRNATDPFYDFSYNVVGAAPMDILAAPGTNAVDLKCTGNGDSVYSLFVDSALIL